jgi:RNA polymerase sigma-70 factor (ECF subfamily)
MIGVATTRQRVENANVNSSGSDRQEDAVLMERLADGEMAALGDLYLRYGHMVAHAVLAASPQLSRHDVEDITQDVFLTVARGAKQYREAGKLRSWLYSIAVRTARKSHRTRKLRLRLLNAVRGRPVAVAGHRTMPEANTMNRMDLYRAFQGLTETQRQVILMFEMQGMSGEEVSELLGVKLNTVWSHLRRARNRIMATFDGEEDISGEN